MIRAVTMDVDIQSLDASLPGRLMGRPHLVPGTTRRIPGGVIAFNSAWLNSEPGQPSVFRFSVQFGSPRAAAAVGNWLFAQLHDSAAALAIAGRAVPIDHGTILRTVRQSA